MIEREREMGRRMRARRRGATGGGGGRGKWVSSAVWKVSVLRALGALERSGLLCVSGWAREGACHTVSGVTCSCYGHAGTCWRCGRGEASQIVPRITQAVSCGQWKARGTAWPEERNRGGGREGPGAKEGATGGD